MSEPRKQRRPSVFTVETASEICRRLSEGESLRSICRDENMPAPPTVRGWALEDREGFSAHYARAREMQAHAWADEIIDIAEDGSNDWMERQGKDGAVGYELNGEHVTRSRLRVDTRKWLLSKMLPRTYGDRLIQEHTVDDLRTKSRDELELEIAELRANSGNQTSS